MATASNLAAPFMPSSGLLAHWQGHRHLTRKVIEAFPEAAFASHSIGGMRPFVDYVNEFLAMTVPMVEGVATGKWAEFKLTQVTTKDEALAAWDAATAELNRLWPLIPAEKFGETITAFGMYEGVTYDLLLYSIDNEIHHRAQGYVYLRSLGIAPPQFYERT
jgi:uncharacterized damage-inducible protein DinB